MQNLDTAALAPNQAAPRPKKKSHVLQPGEEFVDYKYYTNDDGTKKRVKVVKKTVKMQKELTEEQKAAIANSRARTITPAQQAAIDRVQGVTAPEEPLGFTQRVGQDFDRRKQNIGGMVAESIKGNQGYREGAMQAAGHTKGVVREKFQSLMTLSSLIQRLSLKTCRISLR